MKTSDFDYDLPVEFIAQTPVEPRHAARLLVLRRDSGSIEHTTFQEIGAYLKAGDLLVLNETQVIPARVFAHKLPGGGRVELLLLRRVEECLWEALVGGKGLKTGRSLEIDGGYGGYTARIVEELDGARRLVLFSEPIESRLPSIGQMPLPPYIHNPLVEPQRYQTVYASIPGSAAAPTAGLHFTPELMSSLRSNGIGFARVTLHIGLDTFAPVNEEDPQEHQIHTEWCEVGVEAAERINQTHREGGRVIAVGTTSVRTLETAARAGGEQWIAVPYSGPTGLFILPGFHFHLVDALITNFHLPRSTLLMLVSAFAGRERILSTYEIAKHKDYRFFSFGDAMLIL